jgi:hypothetical protein
LACIDACFEHLLERNLLKSEQKPEKPAKISKKPVEIGVFPLTKVSESRKVNGGRVILPA